MKTEKKIKSVLILAVLAAAVVLFGSHAPARANDPNIVFESTPLFNEVDFMPGDAVTRWVKVKNVYSIPRQVKVAVIGFNDSDGLGGQLDLTIKKGANLLYAKTLAGFFSDGLVNLGTVNPGETNQYDFQAVFQPETGNPFMLKKVVFDIKITAEDVLGVCGNGRIEEGEQCDDGNTTGGDGCSAICQNEYCGDGICGAGETCANCAIDCGTCGGGGGGGGGSSGGGESGILPTSQPLVLGEAGQPVLKIEKSASQPEVNPGDEVMFKIIIANEGNLTAFNVKAGDVLPSGFAFKDWEGERKEWLLGDIAPGGRQEINFYALVSPEAKAGDYVNTAYASADNHGTVMAEAEVLVKEVSVLGIDLAKTGFSLIELGALLALIIIFFGLSFVLKNRGEKIK